MSENKDIKFEDAISKLESIVSTLETGKCELDESLALFEEGVSLVKLCSARLESASQKVKILTLNEDSDGDCND